MRKMKKFATGGRAERGQARYDRMMKDIESDYEKAKARKTGRAAEVAKAKYEQRMADAKDDLAKARGEDRTQTRAAEKAAERELTMTRRYGARKIPGLEDADKPLVSARPSDAELTKLTAGVGQKLSDAGNFGSAFRAARNAGDKTFTWRGKSYTTEMAGERPAARPAARPATGGGNKPPAAAGRGTPPAPATGGRGTPPTAGRGTPPATGRGTPPARTAPGFTPSFADKRAAELRADVASSRKLENAPTGTPGAAAARIKKYLGVTASREGSARSLERQAQRQRWRDVEAQGAKDAFEARKAGKLEELRRAAEAPGASGLAKSRYRYAKETGMVGNAKGGSVKGYAKGGKIDGCAVRGKTKAGRK